jgi:hypothetical protein
MSPAQVEATPQIAQATGVPLFIVNAVGPLSETRQHFPAGANNEAALAAIEHVVDSCSGRAAEALMVCRPWREVEHLIIYSVHEECDGRLVEQMMVRGRETLRAIPGVRKVLTGRALRHDTGYGYCWSVRFASPEVVGSYRDHPDHVAFDDNMFRPAAANRISIDFESVD